MDVRPANQVVRNRSDYSKWAHSEKRLRSYGIALPRKNFQVPANATVFTIGSCFARNIEEHLSLIGCNIPTLDFSVPKSEWRARPNGILNKYTPAAIFQEVDWAYRAWNAGGLVPEACNEMRWDTADGKVVDLQLGGFVPVTNERFLERRSQVFDLFCRAFSADCITITLGLIEAWRDKRTGLFIQSAPVARELLRHTDDFEFVLLDYVDCLDFVVRTIAILNEANPKTRILITTSPVPMEKTFSEDDVLIANMTSKSVLRSVAAKVSNNNELVDYFPSYEAVTMQDPKSVYEDDRIHVRDGVVGRIVRHLIDSYFLAPGDLNRFVQEAATELGDKDNGYSSVRKLVALRPDAGDLSTDQLIVLLRSSWRLRDRNTARKTAAEIFHRPERSASHFKPIKHIFPKIGCHEEASRYAGDVLKFDPSNRLARDFLAGT